MISLENLICLQVGSTLSSAPIDWSTATKDNYQQRNNNQISLHTAITQCQTTGTIVDFPNGRPGNIIRDFPYWRWHKTSHTQRDVVVAHFVFSAPKRVAVDIPFFAAQEPRGLWNLFIAHCTQCDQRWIGSKANKRQNSFGIEKTVRIAMRN